MAAFFIIFAMNPSHRDTLPWTPLDTKPSSSQTLFNFRGVAWKMSPLQFSHSHNSNKKKKNRAQKQFVGRLKNVTSCLEERTRVYTRTAAVIQDVEMLKQPQHLRLGILICSSTVNASFPIHGKLTVATRLNAVALWKRPWPDEGEDALFITRRQLYRDVIVTLLTWKCCCFIAFRGAANVLMPTTGAEGQVERRFRSPSSGHNPVWFTHQLWC